MEQKDLRELENRCIQEEPPECKAACPLHVDARAFAGHVREGAWDKAWKILRAVMPLPGILGRLCHGPCMSRCKRGQLGDPIQIHRLEAACVAHPAPRQMIMPLPAKDKTVAVVGSGMSGLTVAWDLARKGYPVTLFEPGPWIGKPLMDLEPEKIGREVIDAETAVLAKLNTTFETEIQVDAEAFLEACLERFDAVYLGLDALPDVAWNLPRDDNGVIQVVPKQQTTGRERVFAGGAGPEAVDRPIWQSAEGRWAATSIDRCLQNVSMTAGREKEGPYETRLFTPLEGLDALPAVPVTGDGYTDAQAAEEAARCLACECMACVAVCPYMESFRGYPKTYAREIYNNESIVMGERKANRLINSCSLCGLCEAVCPNDFAMQDLCLAARQSMVARGKMPPSAHDFALQDMDFSQSDQFFMARHAPGTSQSTYLFFPGCQLCASAPQQVTRVYAFLREKLAGGVALMLGCCGAPAHWSGRQESFAAVLGRWRATWEELGRPTPVMACATCLKMFKDHLPEAAVVSLWEILGDIDLPDSGPYRPTAPLAIHDPCTTRDDPAVQAAVRRLVDRMNVAAEELDLGREHTECCGFGGLMQNANPQLARTVTETRGRRSDSDYLAYCAMCRDNLAAVGKPTVHLLDLLFPDPSVADPARRPRPGWSRRREHRQELKADLLRELWDEPATDADDPDAAVTLIIAPEVEAILESRRILEENLKRVIRDAENGAPRFHHGENGHYLAMQRQGHVTFWVAYSAAEDGYVVHNAYAHRMEVLGP
jgi:NADPH-dependent glutamate synthase beta subunit-like oxidoreductase